MKAVILALAMLVAGPAMAQTWVEPARGTADRSGLMDALRPHAMWSLGGAVEFIVYDLRVAGPLGFASVYPQRPGGGAIDPRQTPAFQRGELDPEFMDGLGLQALLFKSGNTWVAVHWSMGATDVWYAYEPLCAVWRPVIPEACQGI